MVKISGDSQSYVAVAKPSEALFKFDVKLPCCLSGARSGKDYRTAASLRTPSKVIVARPVLWPADVEAVAGTESPGVSFVIKQRSQKHE